jgi:hypothetical protein
MKTISLTDVITKERKSKKFDLCFQKELIINKIAKRFVSLKKKFNYTKNFKKL